LKIKHFFKKLIPSSGEATGRTSSGSFVLPEESFSVSFVLLEESSERTFFR